MIFNFWGSLPEKLEVGLDARRAVALEALFCPVRPNSCVDELSAEGLFSVGEL
jgi:hypothetical protein